MSAYAAAPNAYREQAVLTATPEQLVLMLYDGVNRFLQQAAVTMRDGDLQRSNERLGRAEAILDELMTTLDMSAGEVASNLAQLYLFCKSLLMEARLKRDADKIDQATGLMAELRESWAQIAAQQVSAPPEP